MRQRSFDERLRVAGRAAAYIVVSLPFAVAYVVFEVLTAIVGVLLAPIRVGVPLLLWAEDVVWHFASFERDLGNRLLGARIPPLPAQTAAVHSLRGVRERISGPGFARGLALTAAKLPASLVATVVGIGPAVLTLALLAFGVEGIFAPDPNRFVGPLTLEAPAGFLLCVLAVPAAIA